MQTEEHNISHTQAAARIWLTTWLVLCTGALIIAMVTGGLDDIGFIIIGGIIAMGVGIPALIVLLLAMPGVYERFPGYRSRLRGMYILLLIIALLYGAVPCMFYSWNYWEWQRNLIEVLTFTGCLSQQT